MIYPKVKTMMFFAENDNANLHMFSYILNGNQVYANPLAYDPFYMVEFF